MRHTTLLAVLAFSLLWFHCGSTSDSTLIRQRISRIQTWQLDYASVRELASTNLGQDSPLSSPGQVERNFRFAELTSEILRTKFGLPVSVDTTAACGHIRLTATEVPKGPPKYYDIAVYDSDDQLLVRKRVWNDAQAMTETWTDGADYRLQINQRLAAYIAQQVAELLTSRPIQNQD